MLYFAYYRNLAIEIKSLSELILFEFIKIVNDDIIRFYLPLTDIYFQTLKCLGFLSEEETHADHYLNEVFGFFFRAFAGIITLLNFITSVVFICFGWNDIFYPDLDKISFDNAILLISFSAVTIALYLVNIIFVEHTIRNNFNYSMIGTGLAMIQEHWQTRVIYSIFVAHFISDVYMVQLSYRI